MYHEIDSIVPNTPPYQFLAERNFRVKISKMRGQVSEGLCLPFSAYAYDPDLVCALEKKDEGDDLTELLGVVKYDPDMGNAMNVVGGRTAFPAQVAKTECERIQNLSRKVESDAFALVRLAKTEKIDGTSATFGYLDDVWHTCSRNFTLREPAENEKVDVWWGVAQRYKLREKMGDRLRNIFIQGEIIGPGVNQNTYRLPYPKFYLFAAFDVCSNEYFSLPELEALAKELGVEMVPVLARMVSLTGATVKGLLEDASGKSVVLSTMFREGCVYTNYDRVRSQNRVIFKCISHEFLLKKKE